MNTVIAPNRGLVATSGPLARPLLVPSRPTITGRVRSAD